MKRLTFSERADSSFEQILEWTYERFGARQVATYRDTLMERCRAIAEGRVVHQSCRTIFADDLRDDLRFARAGSHYVIFIETTTEVQIVDFLHQNADIAGRLS